MKQLKLTEKIDLSKTSLIEASAGTGKTFSISHIFLHAILLGMKIEEILVVTFTDAATKELRTRIREILSESLKVCNKQKENETISDIFKLYPPQTPQINHQTLLETAILNIDQSAIFTMHSFCQRMLLENAFESKIAYGAEVIKDSKDILRELVENFWRKHLVNISKEEKELYGKITFDNLLNLSEYLLAFHNVEIVNNEIEPKKLEVINEKSRKYEKYRKILKDLKLIELYRNLNNYIKKEFEKIKQERNILTFNDLITRFHSALLEGNGNNALTQLVRNKFKLALVDEFQDTDNIQYEIFNQLFGVKNNSHGFFMIGDPKQSIYKFRNADIFSYLTAKNNADIKYTLDKNFRSEEGMIEAVNEFFKVRENGEGTFAFPQKENQEGIIFKAVKSGIEKSKLMINNKNENHLNCWLVDGFNDILIERNIANHIANEIINLMRSSQNGKAYFLNKKENQKTALSMGDFAILVDTHKQAKMMKNTFSKSAIPAVIQNSAKIFESWETREFELWIKAIKEPTKNNLLPLFITSMMSKRISEINEIEDKEIFSLAEEFMVFNKQWQKDGIFVTFLTFLKQYKIREEVLKKSNGERIISNYLHLIELLHKNEIKDGKNIARTLVYLQNQIENAGDDEEYTQRLESDNNAVKIMTLHKSKGLEFPIVFYPFGWNKAITKGENKQKVFLFNEKENDKYVQKLDFGADADIKKENRLLSREETIAENIRLLYVALTRAGNRCYLGIGNNKKTTQTALWYLFSDKSPKEIAKKVTSGKASEIYLNEIISKLKKFTKEKNINLVEKSETDIIDIYKEINSNKEKLEVFKFNRKVIKDWSVGSFSSLTKFHYKQHSAIEKGKGVFGLPKGRIFGLAIHKIFENYFNVGKEKFESNYSKYLEQPLKALDYFRSTDKIEMKKRLETVKTMINNVLNAKLATAEFAIYLKDIETMNVKTELDFFYKINQISPSLLKNIFAKFADIKIKDFSEKLGNLNFNLERGFMNGQIDLVFKKNSKYFILDWKTNLLGPNSTCYSENKILENMKESYYILQYHIYCLALHLFLKTQLKEYSYNKHFGGAIYIYTRGIAKQGNGFYFDKPKQELIESLEKNLVL